MSSSILKNSKLQRNENNFVSAELDEEIILMDLGSSDYIGMNPTTSQIWKLLEHPKTLATLVSELIEIYDVSPQQCETDIRPILVDMLERNFIHEQS